MKLVEFLLAGLVIIGIHELSKAQIMIAPNPVMQEVDPEIFDVVGKATVTNTSTRSGTFTWEREIVEISEGWSTAVCDKNLCYLPHVNTASFDLEGEEEGTLDVHIYPAGNEGAAIIHVRVFDVDNAENEDTGVFLFNQTVGTVERLQERIKIFPNPVAQEFFIEEGDYSVDRIELYNISGQIVHAQRMFNSNSVQISHIPTGNYVLRMFAADGKPLSSNLLVKK